MTPAEVDQLPVYLASIMLGAMSPDHTHLSMTAKDQVRYAGMKKWKQPTGRR
jgi:hypothetical protein